MGWSQGWAPIEDHTVILSAIPGTPAAEPEGDLSVRVDAVDRVRRFVGAYSAAKEGLDAERVATFDDNKLLLSDLRVLIGGAE